MHQSGIIPGVYAVSRMSNFATIDPLRLQEMASAFLNGKGWQEIYNQAGGINAWVGKGMPIAHRVERQK